MIRRSELPGVRQVNPDHFTRLQSRCHQPSRKSLNPIAIFGVADTEWRLVRRVNKSGLLAEPMAGFEHGRVHENARWIGVEPGTQHGGIVAIRDSLLACIWP